MTNFPPLPAESLVLPDEAQFALEYVGAIDPTSTAADRDADIAAVMEMAREIDDVDASLLVLNGLYSIATDRRDVARAIESGEDQKYGNGLLEITSLDDVPKAAERFLGGKNQAVIVRAEAWGEDENVGDKITELLAPLGDFQKVGVEQFPKPSMPTGSSGLHLDNFVHAKDGKAGFRYSFSAAELNTGRVMFIAGLAGKRARNVSPKVEGTSHPYDEALIRLEADPKVKQLYSSARDGRPKLKSDFIANEGTHVVSVVLNPGDVVLWPQGGPGSEVPAWHAFRKIDNQDRSSTSYHYIKQPESQPQS
jgi:hypothetical protein